MSKRSMTPELMALVAARFKALAEPARLEMLHALRRGELTVSELIEQTALNQANISKHLQLLYGLGLVARRKDGLFVHYRLADQTVLRLCDLMCGRIEAETKARRKVLAG